MRNFEVRYPTDGTSALQPELHSCSVKNARILSFPNHAVSPDCFEVRSISASRPGSCGTLQGFVRTLRQGNCRGRAYDRFNTGQAVAGGIVLTACSFAGVLLSL